MSLSLRKMSGISMEIYCCLPKPYLLLTCHNVASAFFRRLERVEVDPTGEWLYRALGREELPCSPAKKKGTGLIVAGLALAKPQGQRGTLSSRGMWFILSTLGFSMALAPPALSLARVPRELTDKGISAEVKIRSQGSLLNRQNQTTLYL